MKIPRRILVLGTLASLLVLQAAVPVEAALPLRRKDCGDVIRSSFRLANNLNCTRDGLKIGADGITIDLNGKTIKGDGGDGDYGIDDSGGFKRVTIMTGTGTPRAKIVGFHDGIKIGAGARYVTIRRVRVQYTEADGIDVDGGFGHKIMKVDITSAGEHGIEYAGNGAFIEDVSVLVAGDDGIRLFGNNAKIKRSSFLMVDWIGVKIGSGTGHRIINNNVNGNGYSGIQVSGHDSDIARNRVNENGPFPESPAGPAGGLTFGIFIYGDGNMVELNKVKGNYGDGIWIDLGSANTVQYNDVCGNEGQQIRNDAVATLIQDNVVAETCPG